MAEKQSSSGHYQACGKCGSASSMKGQRACDRLSPYQHHLDSHTPPSELEGLRPQIKSFVTTIRQDLYDANARVDNLRHALEEAEQDRAQVLDFVNAHAALDPPIYHLPPEILAHIFSFTFTVPFPVLGTGIEGPWPLGKVCQLWRKVAWETPSLWSSFSLRDERNIEVVDGDSTESESVEGIESPPDAYHRQVVLDVLARSGQTPLSVNVESYAEPPIFTQQLSACAERLQELRFNGQLSNLAPFVKEMSLLKKLYLNVDGEHNVDTDEEDESPRRNSEATVSLNAPQLTHVRLCVGGHLNQKQFLLPWAQITHLDIEFASMGTDIVVRILSQCSDLVSFIDRTLCDEVDGFNPPDMGATILPHLTYLETRTPLQRLPYITCPALETLAILGYFEEFSTTDWEAFQAFVRRSNCKLQELRLTPDSGLSTIPSAFLQFIQAVSYVPRLEIDMSDTDPPFDMIFGPLKYRGGGMQMFPDLEALTLRISVRSFLGLKGRSTKQVKTEQMIIEIAESRWRVPAGATRIKQLVVELDTKDLLGDEDYEEEDEYEDEEVTELHGKLEATELMKSLKLLKEEGLDVSVISGIAQIRRL